MHDEIHARRRGDQPHPFLVRGVLFIPDDQRASVFAALQALRQGFTGAIHYSEVDRPSGARYETAVRWLRWYRTNGLARCTFKIFAVDQEGFRPFPYPGEPGYEDHVWHNTFTSFVAGVRWSLPATHGILLDIVADSTDEPAFNAALPSLKSRLARAMIEKRAQQRARARRAGKRPTRLAPLMRVMSTRMVTSNPVGSPTPMETEFVQLTDLLLGVLWDAVWSRRIDDRPKGGRISLVRTMRECDAGHIVLPWACTLPVARRVSVSLYPDEHGRAYAATVLRQRPGQQHLDFDAPFPKRERQIALAPAPDPLAHAPGETAPAGAAVVEGWPLPRPGRPRRPSPSRV